MKIIDTHVHFWDPRHTPGAVTPLVRLLGFYPSLVNWVAKKIFPKEAVKFYGSPIYILRKHMPEDIDIHHPLHSLGGVIHIEPGWEGKDPFACVDETQWLENMITGQCPLIKAIVARADLSMGQSVRGVLKGHIRSSPRIRSIRDTLSWHPDLCIFNGCNRPHLTQDPAWRNGFEKLSEFKLHFEATIYDNQLQELADLAENFPEQPLLLCHLGTPVGGCGSYAGIGSTSAERTDIFKRWQDGILLLAECQNVFIKLSGMFMPVIGLGYENYTGPPETDEITERIAPFVNMAIRAFGCNRCMFGSNFPIDKISISYNLLLEAYLSILKDHTGVSLKSVFRTTAETFYRLNRTLPVT